MSRVVVIGPRGDAGFAPLRAQHFMAALQPLSPVLADPAHDDVAGLIDGADVVVSAGNHASTRALIGALATLGPGGERIAVWLDVAGDPFAEAQAASAYAAQPALVARDSQAVWTAALLRADAFSTVSEAGRSACFGALGVLGRASRFPPGAEPIHVVPVAMEFPDAAGPSREPGHHVALVGGFNHWLDDSTLAAALRAAMGEARVELSVYGGPIEGHHVEGFARFREALRDLEAAGRVRYAPWVPHAELAVRLASAHTTVVLDAPGFEPRLGSRTRVLYALHQGLRVIATPETELVAELAGAGLVEAVPAAHRVGRPAAVAAVCAAILAPRGAPSATARAELAARLSPERTGAPLLAFARSPVRSAPGMLPELALAAERDTLRAELAALRGSPTFRVLDKLRRRLPGGF